MLSLRLSEDIGTTSDIMDVLLVSDILFIPDASLPVATTGLSEIYLISGAMPL